MAPSRKVRTAPVVFGAVLFLLTGVAPLFRYPLPGIPAVVGMLVGVGVILGIETSNRRPLGYWLNFGTLLASSCAAVAVYGAITSNGFSTMSLVVQTIGFSLLPSAGLELIYMGIFGGTTDRVKAPSGNPKS